METRTFRAADIRANPFRNLARYELQSEKIEPLRESLRATGWWGNIVARLRKDGHPEIAYGHHRLEALRLEYGEDAEASLIVRDLSDDHMLAVMIRENMEEWETSANVEMESVRAVVEAHGAGRITLDPPPAARDRLRWAPSFVLGDDGRNMESDDRPRPYTAGTVASYLGRRVWQVEKRPAKVLDPVGKLRTPWSDHPDPEPDPAEEDPDIQRTLGSLTSAVEAIEELQERSPDLDPPELAEIRTVGRELSEGLDHLHREAGKWLEVRKAKGDFGLMRWLKAGS